MLGLALALPAVRGPRGDPAANAYIAAMTSAPSATRQGHIQALFASLRTAGVLAKLSHLYLLAAHDAQAARLNAVNPGTNNLSAFNSPTFTVDRGYQGDGSTSYLDTGYQIPSGQQDSAHIGFWSRTDGQSAVGDVGSGISFIVARNTSDQLSHRVTGAASGTVANANGTGHFVSSRTGALSTDNKAYRNAGFLVNGGASTTPDANNIRVLGRSSPVQYSPRQNAAAHIGTGLTAQNITDLYNALNTYLTAVGAA